MIRILTEGIRRGELLGMAMTALPDDLIRNPVIRVVPLKGARVSGQGRLVLLTPSSARAFAIYLRVRRSHRLADSDWVWLGTRPSEAYSAAARVIASGQRVSRRSLRSAGLHGSNADLGMLARLVRASPQSGGARAVP